jgi:hypothetical protein
LTRKKSLDFLNGFLLNLDINQIPIQQTWNSPALAASGMKTAQTQQTSGLGTARKARKP